MERAYLSSPVPFCLNFGIVIYVFLCYAITNKINVAERFGMKFLMNQKLATRIGIITTALTIAGMLLLWLIVSSSAASTVKNDITNQMTDAVESRASIINDYVTSAEEYVTAFALGREVHDLLADPENPELLEEVQTYTEDFASVKGVFEGLYIATPETHVLTHTSKDAVGMTTRTGDSLKVFQDTILA